MPQRTSNSAADDRCPTSSPATTPCPHPSGTQAEALIASGSLYATVTSSTTSSTLNVNTITAASITATSVNATTINATNVNATSINATSISAALIQPTTLNDTNSIVSPSTTPTARITSGNIAADSVAAESITVDIINAVNITARVINAKSITVSQIAAPTSDTTLHTPSSNTFPHTGQQTAHVLPTTASASKPNGPSASTTTRRRAGVICLDAAMYPHLVDEIFKHADYHDLLLLRAACSAWRVRTDSLLARHLIFLDNDLPDAVLNGTIVRHPALLSDAAASPTAGMVLQGCQVLDWGTARDVLPVIASSLKPRFVRMWENLPERLEDEDSQPPSPSDTVVVFGWHRIPFNRHWPLLANCNVAPFAQLPEGTRKLVVNLSGLSREFSPCGFREAPFSPDFIEACATLTDIVFHLAPPEGRGELANGRLVETLAVWERKRSPQALRVHRTFVNFTPLPPILETTPFGITSLTRSGKTMSFSQDTSAKTLSKNKCESSLTTYQGQLAFQEGSSSSAQRSMRVGWELRRIVSRRWSVPGVEARYIKAW